jgi:hypothetical protein
VRRSGALPQSIQTALQIVQDELAAECAVRPQQAKRIEIGALRTVRKPSEERIRDLTAGPTHRGCPNSGHHLAAIRRSRRTSKSF